MFLRWFETIFSSICPFLIIAITNISIVYRLRKVRKTRDMTSNLSVVMQETIRKRENNTTKMVSIASICFPIVAVPMLIHHQYLVNVNFKYDIRMTANLYLSYNICQKLWYTNHDINFFVYALVGEEFKKYLRKYLSCFRRRRAVAPTTSSLAVVQYVHKPGNVMMTRRPPTTS